MTGQTHWIVYNLVNNTCVCYEPIAGQPVTFWPKVENHPEHATMVQMNDLDCQDCVAWKAKPEGRPMKDIQASRLNKNSCPGGNIKKCIDSCSGDTEDAYKACVAQCQKMC